MYKDRIRCEKLLSKVIEADAAAWMIQDGMNIGASGFTPSGYPKAIPLALANQVKEGKRQLQINLWAGASVGKELDGALAEVGVIKKRLPYQTDGVVRKAINSKGNGSIQYQDQHLSHTPQLTRYGFLGKCDLAIIEACAITEDGHIIPTTSVGNSPTFVQQASKVLVEINLSQPLELEGMHDIYIPLDPPNREPIPLVEGAQRIGTPHIECGADKIVGIVITDIPDDVQPLAPIDENSRRMANHLINFLKGEVEEGRLPKNLLPLQSGIGSVANAVLAGLLDSEFEDLTFYSEVIQDSVFDLIDEGKLVYGSATSITPSSAGLKRFKENIDQYKDKIILRPQEISNHPEVARRLGVVAMNTALEVDIYGNVNSTHVMGTKMMNGIGGSGDFTRNSYLSIFTTVSTAKGGAISSIVPMVSHTDHSEHDVSVIVTEIGVADLRNKSPKERALEIINNCAHPDYREQLLEYFSEAVQATGGAHTPHLLERCYEFHLNFMQEGTMKRILMNQEHQMEA